MTFSVVGLFVLGLALLVLGGDWLVRGSSRLSLAMGITPLVVGLTVVAFGTSAPELAVSMIASSQGQPDIAIGNILGSNISNILLIIGISALIAPLAVSQQLIRLDAPIMIGATGLAWLLGSNGTLSARNGYILVALLVVYTIFAIQKSRSETRKVNDDYEKEFGAIPKEKLRSPRSILMDVLLVITGIALLVLGSRWLVGSASEVARYFGVSELTIGLTIVAIGTSLPELATSIVATLKGERDIAVGNVIGSNIFNILCVLGFTASIVPDGVAISSQALRFDFPVTLLVSLAALPILFSNFRIERWEGGLFVLSYAAYITYLILDSTRHPFIGTYAHILIWYVFPVLLALIVIQTFLALRGAARKSG